MMGKTSLYLARNYDGYRKSMEMRCQCSHSLSLLPVFLPPLEFLTLFFSFLILTLSSKCPLPSSFRQNPLGFGVTSLLMSFPCSSIRVMCPLIVTDAGTHSPDPLQERSMVSRSSPAVSSSRVSPSYRKPLCLES